MADGKVVIETDLDSSGIEKGLTNLEKVATKGLKVAAAAITGTATALAGVATAAAKTGADFESQMSRVKAISGATGEEFEKLKAQAIGAWRRNIVFGITGGRRDGKPCGGRIYDNGNNGGNAGAS